MIISVVDLHSTKLNNNNFACLTCIPVYFSMHYLGSGFSILYGKYLHLEFIQILLVPIPRTFQMTYFFMLKI